MRTSLKTTTLAVLALLVLGAFPQQLIADRDKYCSGITFDVYALSAREMRENRDRTWTDFYSDYDALFNYAKNPNSNNFVKMYRWQFGLFLTLVIIIFLSFLFFLFSSCFTIRCGRPCWWECLILFILFFIIFLGLFITIIVFIGISQNKAKRAYCSIHSLPATLLYGNPGANHRQEFIGYQPLMNLMGNYSNEIGNLNQTYNEANSIIGAQLPKITSNLAQNSINVFNNQASQKISGLSLPNSNQTDIYTDTYIRTPQGGPEGVQKEFGALDTLARDIYTTASEIRFLSTNWYVEDSKVALQSMSSQLQKSFDRYRSVSEDFTYRAMKVQSYAVGGFWTFFGLGIAIIILSLVVIIVYCCARRGKCLNCGRFMKFILILLSFIIVVYAICVLILMAGVAAMSSFCRFTAELNQGGWVAANTFETYINQDANYTLNNTQAGYLLKGCFYANSSGYIPSMLNSTSYVSNSYDRLINLVNGLTTYNQYIKTYGDFSQNGSAAIAELRTILDKKSAGDLYDNTQLYLMNNDINSRVSCSGRQYAYTGNACTNYFWASCSAFTNPFSVPSCASNPSSTIEGYLDKIRGYVGSEVAYITNLKNGYVPIETEYLNALSAMKVQQTNIDAIRAKLPNTLNVVNNYNGTLKEIVNCNNLQVEMMRFERYACFPFVKPLYVLLVLALVSTFFLLLMMWALWTIIATHTVATQEVVVVRREEFLAVSEQELVPKY